MRKNGNKGKKYNGNVSLYPLKFEQAVKNLLEVKTESKSGSVATGEERVK